MRTSIGSFLAPEGFSGPQGLRALSREGSIVVEVARLAAGRSRSLSLRRRTPYVLRSSERQTHPIVLVPGFLAGDYALRAMAGHLRGLGFRTYRSSMSPNVKCVQRSGDALEARLEAIVAKRGQKVVLVGHSLGGMISRGLAAKRPDLVIGIVTLGSPVLAPAAVHKALLLNLALLLRLQRIGLGSLMSAECTTGECAQQSWEKSQRPLPAGFPYTAVYSKRDGIVDWRACLDPAATHVEVRTSHCGMAIDPLVFDVVTQALVQYGAQTQHGAAAVRLTARSAG